MGKRRKRLRRGVLLLTVLWICFIFSRSLQNADSSDSESGFVLRLLQKLNLGVSMHFVRKLAHFTEFWILGFLSLTGFCLYGKKSFLLPALFGLLIAAADETIQRFVPGRSGQIMDVLLDFCGVAAGCLAALVIRRLLLWRRKRKENRP